MKINLFTRQLNLDSITELKSGDLEHVQNHVFSGTFGRWALRKVILCIHDFDKNLDKVPQNIESLGNIISQIR